MKWRVVECIEYEVEAETEEAAIQAIVSSEDFAGVVTDRWAEPAHSEYREQWIPT